MLLKNMSCSDPLQRFTKKLLSVLFGQFVFLLEFLLLLAGFLNKLDKMG